MSNRYYVTADNINGKEKQYINKVIQTLESQGHTAINGGVDPNAMQHYGLKKKSQGMIGMQIIGGRDGWTGSDMVHGMKKGYYHYDYVIMCGCKEFKTGTHITAADMDTEMHRAPDAGPEYQSMYIGKTPNQFNKTYSSCFKWVLTDSFNDMLAGITGNTNISSGSGGSTTYKNGIESIKDLIRIWDGEVEVKIRGNKVYINKIDKPQSDLLIGEGFNIVSDSITLHDYNPDTTNILHATYDNKKVSMVDEYLVKRDGKHEQTIEAKKVITKYTEGDSKKDTESDTTTTDTSSTKRNVTYSEKPIKKESEAINFLKKEWNKIRRDNNHQLELKVIGARQFKSGEWVKVYIPSFNEDGYMYVTKTQHSTNPSSEWLTSLTLSDYPPQLSEPEQENMEDNKEDDSNLTTD